MKSSLDRMSCVAALVAAAGLTAVGFVVNADFYHDDAFIGLRYARNLITARGLVWNPGERVEGYTNGLFTILEAILGWAGVSLVRAPQVLSVLAFLTIALFAWAGSPKSEDIGRTGAPLRIVPFVLVLTSFPLMVWTVGGLEGPFFAMLIAIPTWSMKETLGRGPVGNRLAVSGLLFGLACAVRMDGLLFVATSLVFLLADSGESRLRRFVTFSIPFLAIFLPYEIWRLAYYGSAVPNTFWVKAAGASWYGARSGLGYVTSYLTTPPFVSVLAGVALLCAWLLGSFDRRMRYVLSSILLYLLYVIGVGGDHMPACRLMLPIIPLTALLLGEALVRVMPRAHPSAGPVLLLSLMVLAGLQVTDPRVNPRRADPAAFVGTIVGQHIASVWRPGSLVALNTAGSTPFYAEGFRFVDMLGLNDAHIARRRVTEIQIPWQSVPGHLKGDGAYVLRRQPDYIIVGPAEGATIQEPLFLSDLEMERDPLFQKNYTLRSEEIDVTGSSGFKHYLATHTGTLSFIYYERKKAENADPRDPSGRAAPAE